MGGHAEMPDNVMVDLKGRVPPLCIHLSLVPL